MSVIASIPSEKIGKAQDEVVISILLGTYNRLPQLRRCVESVCRETTAAFRLFISDAGSTDGTIEYLQDLAAQDVRIELDLLGERIGQAMALNRFLDRIESPYACWISDDNVVVNQSLDVAAQILRDHPEIGMVGLKVRDVLGPFTDAEYIGGISSIGILNVNQGMLRTDIFRKLGGFSRQYRDYGMDPDLTARVIFRGWNVAYTRDIGILHYREWVSTSCPAELSQRHERQAQSLEAYRERFDGVGGWSSHRSMGMKRRVFRYGMAAIRRMFGNCHDSRVFGYSIRDWKNIFNSRYISILDPIRYRSEAFYLVQSGDYDPRVESISE